MQPVVTPPMSTRMLTAPDAPKRVKGKFQDLVKLDTAEKAKQVEDDWDLVFELSPPPSQTLSPPGPCPANQQEGDEWMENKRLYDAQQKKRRAAQLEERRKKQKTTGNRPVDREIIDVLSEPTGDAEMLSPLVMKFNQATASPATQVQSPLPLEFVPPQPTPLGAPPPTGIFPNVSFSELEQEAYTKDYRECQTRGVIKGVMLELEQFVNSNSGKDSYIQLCELVHWLEDTSVNVREMRWRIHYENASSVSDVFRGLPPSARSS